ncbi:MAG: hypothetical protein IKX61_01525 [Prevotella sp.]|nr:hypothetical protein [Prevotella sp.]
MMLPILWACSSEEVGGDNATPAIGTSYVRFVSSAGTNMLDSLKVIDPEVRLTANFESDLLDVTVIRKSDDEILWLRKNLLYACEQTGLDFKCNETIIYLYWTDFMVWDIEKRPWYYKDVYEVQMKSPKIFGNNDVHTIRWYITVTGRVHDAYKCEVDGEEISLEDDPFYKQQFKSGTHHVAGFVTIHCK